MSRLFYETPFAKSQSSLSRIRHKKRKRDQARDEHGREQDEAGSDVSSEDLVPKLSQSTWAELLSEEVSQRQTAGLAAGEEIPGDQFPNKPQDYKPYSGTCAAPSEIQRQLFNLKPPLIDHLQKAKQLEASRSSLKQQHINVLYTILHRCLLDRDYLRAGRAFGLLIRTESLGKLPDLRDKSLWGIGAEILLHSKAQASKTSGRSEDQSEQIRFDRDGVEDVKQYFEKLIIQFPYRAQRSQDVSAAQFYPVLFGLLIASLDDKHKSAIRSVRANSANLEDGLSIAQTDEIDGIRRSILSSARVLSQRMSEVMQSVHYSDDPELWDLRGHLYMWISSLSTSQQLEDESSSLERSEQDMDVEVDDQRISKINAQNAFSMAARLRKANLQQTMADISDHSSD